MRLSTIITTAKKLLFISLCIVAPCTSMAFNNITRIVVFGDSLSDNGNDFLLSTRIHKVKSDVPIVPAPDLYWNGRFSDGPVWVEYIAGMTHFLPQQRDANVRKNSQFIDQAYGGAWAETTSPSDDPNHPEDINRHLFPMPLGAQVDDFLYNYHENAPTDKQAIDHDLFFIWTGGNDYLNHDMNSPPKARPPEQASDLVIAAIKKNILKLINQGGKHFVLLGLPDLSRIPDIILRDPQRRSLAPKIQAASRLHNEKLQGLISQLQRQYPRAQFTFIPIDPLFNQEFNLAQERRKQYKRKHPHLGQHVSAPCILLANDPDPTQIYPHHRSAGIASHTHDRSHPYRYCDLHRPEDQASAYTYSEDYTAGGTFFDHIHPLAPLHARVALHTCKALRRNGYTFTASDGHTRKLECEQYSVDSLIQSIVDPAFPKQ